MARKLNPQGLIDQKNYVFRDHAQYKDKVNTKFIEICQRSNLPVNFSEEVYKSGGFLNGSKDVLLTIDGGLLPFAVLGVTTYGQYLNVSLYFLVEDTFFNKTIANFSGSSLERYAYANKNMISIRDTFSFWHCIVAALEESFAELKFEEFKSGFLGID